MNQDQQIASTIATIALQQLAAHNRTTVQQPMPALLQNILQAMQQQQQNTAQTPTNNSNSFLSRSPSMSSVSSATQQQQQDTAQTPTHNSNSFLSRSASMSSGGSSSRKTSLASTLSDSPTESENNDGEGGDWDVKRQAKRKRSKKKTKKKPRKRRASDPQLKHDKKLVNDRLMNLLDEEYFAPQGSELFFHSYTQDGHRKLKEEMDVQMFNKLTAELTRDLLVEYLPVLRVREQNPQLSPIALKHRLNKAMLLLAKKRRANHLQHWRLKERHAGLIYSADWPDANLNDGARSTAAAAAARAARVAADAARVRNHLRSRAVHVARRQTPADEQDSGVDFEDEDESQVPTQDSEVDFEDEDESQAPTTQDSEVPELNARNRMIASAAAVVAAQARRAESADVSTPVPPVTIHKVVSTCADCGKRLEFNSAFPQDHQKEWATMPKLRCIKCYDKYVQSEMIPLVANPTKKRQVCDMLSKLNAAKDADDKDTAKANDADKPKRKRNKRTTCKHCGRSDHLSIRSLKCPKNPKNKTAPGNFFQFLENMDDCTPHFAGYFDPLAVSYTTGTASSDVPSPSKSTSPDVPSPSKSTSPDVTSPSKSTSPDVSSLSKSTSPDVPSPSKSSSPNNVPSPSKSTTAEGGPCTPPEPLRMVFNVGNNCLAKWKGTNCWYLAQVVSIEDNKYTLYFPEDGKLIDGYTPNRVRSEQTPTRTRAWFLNKTFFASADEDLPAGMWKVRRLENRGIEFVCTRLTGPGKNIENFDVGYVMRAVTETMEKNREIVTQQNVTEGNRHRR